MLNRKCFYAIVLAATVFLGGCDDNDNSAVVASGVFLDAPVANIGYRTATQSGLTDENGNYNYIEGEEVTFFIGDLELPPVPAKGVVTPVDIAQALDASATIDSNTAINIARTLQSLDSDGDPSNGITIPAISPAASIDFSADPATFEAAFAAEFPSTTLVSAAAAKAHLQAEIDAQNGGGSGAGETSQFCPDGATASSLTSLPVGLSGVVADLTVTFADAASPVALDSMANFTFSSSGALFIDNNEVSSEPYQCSGSSEVRWTNADESLVYAASVQSDQLNEVNIFSPSGSFLAQYEDLAGTTPPAATFTIAGAISNDDAVSGQWELFVDSTLLNDGGLTTASSLTFGSAVTDGASYQITTSSNNCTVTNGSGVVSGADINNVSISCQNPTPPPAATYTISGSISNDDAVAGQWELFVDGTLQNDGGLSTASSVTFGSSIADGTPYQVTVSNNNCGVTNGSGTISGTDVTDVAISCTKPAPATYTISGTVNGLVGSMQIELYIAENFADDLPGFSGTSFSFNGIADASLYEIRTNSYSESGLSCLVSNDGGMVNGADISDVVINCSIDDDSPNGTTTAATVHSDLAGDYTLVYSQNSTGGPFVDGQEVSVSISAGGTLTMASNGYDSPFNRDLGAGPHLPEIIWLDSAADIEFALSDNQSGSFNEINVGDASRPTSAIGIPAFLGQLRLKEEENTAADIVGIYEGFYSFVITEGSGAGGNFDFSIGSDGSISYTRGADSVVISPDEATYGFNDTRPNTTIEPGLEVSHRVPDTETGTYEYVKLFFEDQDVVAFSIGTSFTAELRPLPMEVSDMMASLIAASPVEMRVTKESNTYGGSFVPNGGLCQAISVEFEDPVDTATFASDLQVGFVFYQRVDWRYNLDAGTGVQSLGRNSIQINLDSSGDISLGEGFVDRGTLLMSNPRDFATTVQSEIDTVCADYQAINVVVNNNLASASLSGQLIVKDTDTLTTLLTLPAATFFNIAAASAETFKVFLPTATNYSIELDNVSIPNGASCTGTNTAGQVATVNADVSFDCKADAADYSLSGSISNTVGATGQWETFINGGLVHDGGLSTNANVNFTFSAVPDGSTYEVRVSSNPSDACTTTNGTGTINGADITDIEISCN